MTTTNSDSQRPLAGQVAIITGGGRGIGRAIAIAYAEAGASVCVTARTSAEIDKVAAEIAVTSICEKIEFLMQCRQERSFEKC